MTWTPSALERQLTEGTERGAAIVKFLRDRGLAVERLKVLDLGCGPGGIMTALAEAASRVVGVDYRPDSFAKARLRLARAGVRNAVLVRGDALNLPLASGTFDLVVLNGVLEWIPEARGAGEPTAVQLAALREIWRVLRPGGHLYLAIENRYYPPHLVRDPHARLALTAALPRPLADVWSRWRRGAPYRTYIHSFWGLRRLLTTSGFRVIEPCVAVTNYYFPVDFVRVDRPAELTRVIREFTSRPLSPEYRRMAIGRYGRAKLLFWRIVARARLVRLLAGAFAFLCQKPATEPRDRVSGPPRERTAQ